MLMNQAGQENLSFKLRETTDRKWTFQCCRSTADIQRVLHVHVFFFKGPICHVVDFVLGFPPFRGPTLRGPTLRGSTLRAGLAKVGQIKVAKVSQIFLAKVGLSICTQR